MENETKQPVSKLEKAALNIRIYASLSFLVVFAFIDSVSIALVVSSVKNDDGPVGFSIFILLVFLAFTYVSLMSFLKNNKARNELYKKEAEQNVNQDDFVDIDQIKLEVRVGSVLKPEFEIMYRDARNNLSCRKIHIFNFDGRLIDAYCFNRRENRSFLVSRIEECVDLSTGEVIKGDLKKVFAKYDG